MTAIVCVTCLHTTKSGIRVVAGMVPRAGASACRPVELLVLWADVGVHGSAGPAPAPISPFRIEFLCYGLRLWLTWRMENSRFLECLAADYSRIREIVPGHLEGSVPSCPDWTVGDLVQHVGAVYLHKSTTMREGKQPEEWPPPWLNDEDPVVLLDRAYAELVAEFGRRKPEDVSETWYGPDQTVVFWIRRMAQETVIHRIDAELGTGEPVAPVPDDLAVDGIDELLKVFTAFSVAEWDSYFTDILGGSPGRTYEVRTDGAAWRVRTGPGLFVVEDRVVEGHTAESGSGDGSGDGTADVTLSGPPAAVLGWVWNREKAGEPSGVTVEGPPDAVEELRRCIVVATQ